MSVRFKALGNRLNLRLRNAFSAMPLSKGIDSAMFGLMRYTIRHPAARWRLGNFRVIKNELDGDLRIIIIKGEKVQEYVFCKDDRGISYIISLPKISLHSQLIEVLEDALHVNITFLKGGMMAFDKDEIALYGFSSVFGAADHRKISNILRAHGIKAHS